MHFICVWLVLVWLTANNRKDGMCDIDDQNHCGPKSISLNHYSDVIMSRMASQIASLTIVHSTVNSRRRRKKTSKLHITGLCDPCHHMTIRSLSPYDVTRPQCVKMSCCGLAYLWTQIIVFMTSCPIKQDLQQVRTIQTHDPDWQSSTVPKWNFRRRHQYTPCWPHSACGFGNY